MALRLSFYLLISLQLVTPQLFAQSGSVAVFPFTVAGKVSASEAAEVQQYIRAAVTSFGLSVKSLDEMRLKIKQIAPITEYCEERDASCFAKLADQLEVHNLIVGYVERADTRLAIDVRLYEREVAKDPNGAITKQDLQYYEAGPSTKITLQQVCHRAI